MALEEDSLAVCQPEKNGKYESCRIFYDEMDKIVEGSRRGIPEFYIVIRKEGKEQKSFFLLDEEEQERDRRNMAISSYKYGVEFRLLLESIL